MLIYLIRHGETAYNQQGRYQGSADLPLSDYGRAQLKQADFSPKKVYISPLVRARETAECLFPDGEFIPIPGFQEMHFGHFEGRSADEMSDDPEYRAWVDSGCQDACPGGESKAQFFRRVQSAFLTVLQQAQAEGEDSLVLVAHGGTQMAILEAWGIPERPYYQWQTPNGCGFLLEDGLWQEKHRLTLVQEVSFIRSAP